MSAAATLFGDVSRGWRRSPFLWVVLGGVAAVGPNRPVLAGGVSPGLVVGGGSGSGGSGGEGVWLLMWWCCWFCGGFFNFKINSFPWR